MGYCLLSRLSTLTTAKSNAAGSPEAESYCHENRRPRSMKRIVYLRGQAQQVALLGLMILRLPLGDLAGHACLSRRSACCCHPCISKQWQHLMSSVVTVSQCLNQPYCNRLAKFLTWIKKLRLDTAWSDGSARPQTGLKFINPSIN